MCFNLFCSNKFAGRSIHRNYDCYEAIRYAVAKSYENRVDVKQKLGSELIETLSQVFQLYFHEYRDDFERRELRKMYEDLQALLGFAYRLPANNYPLNDSSSDED